MVNYRALQKSDSLPASPATIKKWAPIEFGGPWGTGFIIVVSHVLLYWVWWIVNLNQGELMPRSGDWSVELRRLANATTPTFAAAWLYFCFLAVQFFFAFVMPGIDSKGRADENGQVGGPTHTVHRWVRRNTGG